ncbi:MAG: glucosamine inositolphosphorylceramide transferase family protein [Marinobacter sp.]|uniref:glucosamine inositolphosphorylceramide transferase family protein n=1 Tax=Marinobacter sp. TaxID=50741 RepID=UPI003F9D4F4E
MRKLTITASVFIIFSFGLGFGYLISKKQIFPYHLLEYTYNFIKHQKNKNVVESGPWSIGVYEGDSPFNLHSSGKTNNPVLTASDVTDVDATFVADPFFIRENDSFSMFFEVFNRKTGHGDLAYAESPDGDNWSYKSLIIDEPFHLSYPHVFEWDGEFYLIAESYADLSVRLYKAKKFPSDWEYVGNLLSGYPYIDPTIVRHNDKWWLFVSTPSNENLNLYFSEELDNSWTPHPMNPIVRKNKNIARPAGRILQHDDSLFRIAQDDYPEYGTQVFGFKIIELNEKSYREVPIDGGAILSGSGKGWNGAGMHQLDALKIGDKWKAVVDGRDR